DRRGAGPRESRLQRAPVPDREEAERVKRPVASVLLHLVLLVGVVAALAPLAWMVAASLMPTGEANSFPPRFLPSRPTLVHYRELFTRLNIGRTFGSSLLASSASMSRTPS